jgi:chlorophyll synthase
VSVVEAELDRPRTAATHAPTPKAVLELLKPITWFPPIWAFGCGVVSAGGAHWPLVVAGLVLSGPMACGASQAINDWFDRNVDAINEPGRPIPSGRIPGHWGLWIAILWSALSLGLAFTLGPIVAIAAFAGLILAWAYSAPPVRLKRNGWWSALACGFSYEGLPWFAGAALCLHAMPGPPVLIAAGLYSLGAHGIMTLNDFKSIEGDRRLGLGSLPARLGPDIACRIACVVMAAAQLGVVVFLLTRHATIPAAIVAALLAAQLLLMRRLLADPRGRTPWYNGTGTTLYVLGMLVTAFAIKG